MADRPTTLQRTIEAPDPMDAERQALAACREHFGDHRFNWRVAMTHIDGGVTCELTAEEIT